MINDHLTTCHKAIKLSNYFVGFVITLCVLWKIIQVAWFSIRNLIRKILYDSRGVTIRPFGDVIVFFIFATSHLPIDNSHLRRRSLNNFAMPRRFRRDTESIRQLLRRLLPPSCVPRPSPIIKLHSCTWSVFNWQPRLINRPYIIVGKIMAIEGKRMRAVYNI